MSLKLMYITNCPETSKIGVTEGYSEVSRWQYVETDVYHQ